MLTLHEVIKKLVAIRASGLPAKVQGYRTQALVDSGAATWNQIIEAQGFIDIGITQ
jgi:hypothetical protein